MVAPSDSIFVRSLQITGVVSLYWVVSISLVFLNKYLLSSDDVKLDAPIFITWFQCVVTVAICVFLSQLSRFFPDYVKAQSLDFSLKTCLRVLPLSIIFVGMIASNNLCLKNVGVAFYYIGRSLTTVFNVIFTFTILGKKTSLRALLACLVIVLGFLLGVDQENVVGSLSIAGVSFGIAASMFVALFAIYTTKTLPLVDDNILLLNLYNNINATILFLPLILFFGELYLVTNFVMLYSGKFWFFMVMSGILGFGIGYVTSMQIKFTSALTHNVSGTAKACAQTVLGYMVYNEHKTYLWWLSNFTVLAGSAAYTHVRHSEMKKDNSNDHVVEVERSDKV